MGTVRLASFSDRLTARLVRPGRIAGEALKPGLPRATGSVERGRDLLGGRCRLGGELIETRGRPIWDALPAGAAAIAEAHGFAWLDDLAAVAEPDADALARSWTHAWIRRFGGGRGPGWTAELAGARVATWTQNGEMLGGAFGATDVARHVAFLARRSASAAAGWPRAVAMAGQVHGALSLSREDPRATTALAGLAQTAPDLIAPRGTVETRSPEDLARALLLLTVAADAAAEHGHEVPRAIDAAIVRGAATLRALVQPDGCLPRFHGGSAAPGLADVVLAAAGRVQTDEAVPMGFAGVRHGRTGLVLDAAPPSVGAAAVAHASTLGFELTVGRRALVVNCGAGTRFGARWRRAARATASHSTLAVEGVSSSRLSGRAGDLLLDVPRMVRVEREADEAATHLVAAHDGYGPTHGLVHHRRLVLARDGRTLAGEDALVAESRAERRLFDQVRRKGGAVRFAIRFHLHPSVDASLDLGGRAVSLALPSGAIWVFRVSQGSARLALDPSVSLSAEALEPVATTQIVLFSSCNEYATRVAWSFGAAPGGDRRDTAA